MKNLENPMTKMPVLLLLAACGSSNNNTTPDAAGHVDAMIDGMEAVASRAAVVAGDFTAGDPGVLGTVEPEALTAMPNVGPQGSVGDDPVLRHFGHELFIVNRADGNNITILDDTTLALVDQLGTGASSNPQDVAVVGQKLYVPVFGGIGVVVLTRGTGTMLAIDLSSDDPDGKPNCATAFAVGTDVYVACEILDDTNANLPPRGPGKVYVIDTTTDTKRATLTLAHVNPFGNFEQSPAISMLGGDLVIMTDPFGGTGCVERVTPGATPVVHGCAPGTTGMDGYASRITFVGNVMFMAVAASDFMHASLIGDDFTGSPLSATSPATEVIGDAAGCPDGRVVVSDTTMAASGIRVYLGPNEQTTAPLNIGLRPQSAHGIVCY